MRAEQTRWLHRVETDLDNIRAALEWSLEHDLNIALHISGELAGYWVGRGYSEEGRHWLNLALGRPKAREMPAYLQPRSAARAG